MMILNVGCKTEDRWVKGYYNVDIADPCDKKIDLNIVPYDFPDDKFSGARVVDILEHLDNWEGCLSELIRVCENGSMINIRVPIGPHSLMHPNHRRVFGIKTFESLKVNDGRYGPNGFDIVSKRVNPTRVGWFIPVLPVPFTDYNLREYCSLFIGEVIRDMDVVLQVNK